MEEIQTLTEMHHIPNKNFALKRVTIYTYTHKKAVILISLYKSNKS